MHFPGGRCPMPGKVQGQVGHDSEQSDTGEYVPASPKLFYD